MAISASNNWLIHNDGPTIRLRDLATGKQIRTYHHEKDPKKWRGITKVAFSKDESKVGILSKSGEIHIWARESGKRLYFAKVDSTLPMHSSLQVLLDR